ncbi:hypothetical protein ACWCPF_34615 [Streptomyces sp. NPDC001858]
MHNKSKKFRLAAVAVAAASAAVAGVAAPAAASDPSTKADGPSVNASGFPDEGRDWNLVTYSGGPISSQSTPGEARDNRGNVLHAWRGKDNDYIWISLNNGSAYQLPISPGSPNAQTYAAPTVIWTDDGNRGNFRIFHTGRDGDVWQHRIQLNAGYQLPETLPYGAKISNDTRTSADLPVAAAALPDNSFMLAWNSQSNDDIWTMFYNAAIKTFENPRVVPNALSKDAPSLAAQVDVDNNDPAPWNQVVLAFTGTDNSIYMARQRYGASSWTNPWKLSQGNGWSRHAPSVALSPNGYGVISLAESDNTIGSYLIVRDGGWSGFYEEPTFALSYGRSPLAVMDGTALYYVINGSQGTLNGVLWKRVTDFGSMPKPAPPQW